MLSDELLRPIYVEAFNKAMHDKNSVADAGLTGLRAVAEAALKDERENRNRPMALREFAELVQKLVIIGPLTSEQGRQLMMLQEMASTTLEAAVKDAVGGVVAELRAVTCPRCCGSGDSASGRTPCGGCDGSGSVQDVFYARPQASAAVPEGILSIARRMVEESKENDHCTAHPVFIVQKRRIVTGIDTEYTDNIAWVSEGEILDAEESSALEAAYQDTGQVPDDYTRTGYCEEWEHIDAYLTERAALSRCSGAPDYRVTVESAYRNKEMQIVRAFLMSLSASQPEVK